jgi:hypothetical protein
MILDEGYFKRKRGAGHWTRLDIALALSGPPRTKAECARAMGREYASISGAFDEMLSDQVIEEVPGDAGPSTQFRLAAGIYEVVEHARMAEEPTGHLLPGQILVEITAGSQETLRTAMAQQQLVGIVAWVSRVSDEPARALLALSPQAAPAARERLLAAFPQVGVQCHAIPIQDVLPAPEYRREGESVLGAIEDMRRVERRRGPAPNSS